jgi:tRNA(Ile)-lysidine synthase
VRTFRPGDRIQPLGMSGRKKVKDIFIDCKIPLAQRRRTALLFCGSELIWVVGLRTSQLARVDSSSSSSIISAVFTEN